MAFAFGFILGIVVGAIAAILVCCIFRPKPQPPNDFVPRRKPHGESEFYRRKVA